MPKIRAHIEKSSPFAFAARGLWIIALAALSASCSLSPAHTRPAMPVPAAIGGGAPSGGSALPWEKAAVEEFFPEPRLLALIELGFLNNRDLRLAMLSIASARASSSMARSERLPMLEAGAGLEAEWGPSRETERSYSGEAMVPAFELDLFGRLRDMEAKAFEEYLQSYESYRAFRIALVSRIAEAYFELRLLSEKEALTRSTLNNYRNSLAFVENRVVSGQSSLLDLEEARAQADSAEAMLLELKIEKTRAENGLALLVGSFEPAESLPPPKKLGDVLPPRLQGTAVPSEALLKRPDILAAEHKLMAARYDIGAARANFFPKISLTGALSFMSMDLGRLFESGSAGWSYSPALSVPIFNAGKNRAALEIAEIMREEAFVSYEAAIQTAFKEALDALLTLDDLEARLSAEQKRLGSQRRVLELAKVRYQSGSISYLEVLDAQRNVYEAEESVLDAQKNLLSGHVGLFAALGGGLNTEGLPVPDVPYAPEEPAGGNP